MRLGLAFSAVILVAAASAPARAVDLNVITKVEVRKEGGATLVTIQGSRPPSFTTFSMMDPPRFVVDLSESQFQGVPEDVPVGDETVNIVKNLSYGSAETSIARVLVAFNRDVEPPDVQAVGTSLVVRIAAAAPAGAAVAQAAPAPSPAGAGAAPAAEAAAPAAGAAGGAASAAVPSASEPAAAATAAPAAVAAADQAAAEKATADKAAADKAAADKAAADEAALAADRVRQEKENQELLARRAAQAKAEAEAAAKAKAEEDARVQVTQLDELNKRKAEAKARAEQEQRDRAAEEARAKVARAERAAQERAAQEAQAKAAAEAGAAQDARAKAAAGEEQERARAAAQAQAEEREWAAKQAAATPAQAAEAEKAPKLAAVEPARAPARLERPATRARPAHVREIGFQQLPESSRVFVKLSAAPRFQISEVGENVIRLELENSRVDRRNDTRFLDTSFFPTAVAMVTPRARGNSYVVDIRLKEKVPYQQKVEGDMLAIDFERPASMRGKESPAAAPQAPAEPAPAAEPGAPAEPGDAAPEAPAKGN